MSQDYNPFDPINRPRDAMDLVDKLNKAKTADEALRTRKLLEEQARLQQESLELQKQRLALEQERLKLEREQQELQKRDNPASMPQPPSQPPTPPPSTYSPQKISGNDWWEDYRAVRAETDPSRKVSLSRQYEAIHGTPKTPQTAEERRRGLEWIRERENEEKQKQEDKEVQRIMLAEELERKQHEEQNRKITDSYQKALSLYIGLAVKSYRQRASFA